MQSLEVEYRFGVAGADGFEVATVSVGAWLGAEGSVVLRDALDDLALRVTDVATKGEWLRGKAAGGEHS